MFTQNPSETTDTQTNALTPSSISEKHELADGGTLHIKTFDQLTTSELYNLLYTCAHRFLSLSKTVSTKTLTITTRLLSIFGSRKTARP